MTQLPVENSSAIRQPDAPIRADDWPQTVVRLVNSVKYGSVQILIQDGRIFQIDSTDKIRFEQPRSRNQYGHKPAASRGQ